MARLQLWSKWYGTGDRDLYWLKPKALESDADFIPAINALNGCKTEVRCKGSWTQLKDYSKETL